MSIIIIIIIIIMSITIIIIISIIIIMNIIFVIIIIFNIIIFNIIIIIFSIFIITYTITIIIILWNITLKIWFRDSHLSSLLKNILVLIVWHRLITIVWFVFLKFYISRPLSVPMSVFERNLLFLNHGFTLSSTNLQQITPLLFWVHFVIDSIFEIFVFVALLHLSTVIGDLRGPNDKEVVAFISARFVVLWYRAIFLLAEFLWILQFAI